MKRLVFSILSAACGVLLITVAAAEAGEVGGVVKKIDAGKNMVVVTVGGKDKTFLVNKDASFTSVSMTKNKKGKVMEKVQTIDTLAGIKVGAKVTHLTETVDEKEVARAVNVDGSEGKANAKKKKSKAEK